MASILFMPYMAGRIRDGFKTQTRRFVDRRGKLGVTGPLEHVAGDMWRDANGLEVRCPYGQVGGELIARTTWAAPKLYNSKRPKDLPLAVDLWSAWRCNIKPYTHGKARSGRYLPRELYDAGAARLGVTEIRAHFISDTTEEDAKAEGVELSNLRPTYRAAFFGVWDDMYAREGGGHYSNPLVWAVTFDPLRLPG